MRVQHRRQQRVRQSFSAETAVCSRVAGTYQRLTSSASASNEERHMQLYMLGQTSEVVYWPAAPRRYMCRSSGSCWHGHHIYRTSFAVNAATSGITRGTDVGTKSQRLTPRCPLIYPFLPGGKAAETNLTRSRVRGHFEIVSHVDDAVAADKTSSLCCYTQQLPFATSPARPRTLRAARGHSGRRASTKSRRHHHLRNQRHLSRHQHSSQPRSQGESCVYALTMARAALPATLLLLLALLAGEVLEETSRHHVRRVKKAPFFAGVWQLSSMLT